MPRKQVSEDDGLEHLLRRYLSAFGSAPRWRTRRAGPACNGRARPSRSDPTRTFATRTADSSTSPCVSRRGRPCAVRFLGHWDAALLVHVRRAQCCPSDSGSSSSRTKHPSRWRRSSWTAQSPELAGRALAQKATLRLAPFEPLRRAAREELRAEGERLVRFHEPDGSPPRRDRQSALRSTASSVRRRTASARARARRGAPRGRPRPSRARAPRRASAPAA